jgi:hypothetical protein
MLLGISDFTHVRIRGTIAGVPADTMDAHEIGGFLRPSANRFFKLFFVSREEIKQKSCCCQFELKTRENYNETVKAYASNPEKQVKLKSICYVF